MTDDEKKALLKKYRPNLTMSITRSFYEDEWTETVVDDREVLKLIDEVISQTSLPAASEPLDTLAISIDFDDGVTEEIEVHATGKMLGRLNVWLDRKRGKFHEAAASEAGALKYDARDPGNWRDGDDAVGNARAAPPEKQASHSEGDAEKLPVKYYKDGGTTHAVYGSSSISYVETLRARFTVPHSLTVAQGDEQQAFEAAWPRIQQAGDSDGWLGIACAAWNERAGLAQLSGNSGELARQQGGGDAEDAARWQELVQRVDDMKESEWVRMLECLGIDDPTESYSIAAAIDAARAQRTCKGNGNG